MRNLSWIDYVVQKYDWWDPSGCPNSLKNVCANFSVIFWLFRWFWLSKKSFLIYWSVFRNCGLICRFNIFVSRRSGSWEVVFSGLVGAEKVVVGWACRLCAENSVMLFQFVGVVSEVMSIGKLLGSWEFLIRSIFWFSVVEFISVTFV